MCCIDGPCPWAQGYANAKSSSDYGSCGEAGCANETQRGCDPCVLCAEGWANVTASPSCARSSLATENETSMTWLVCVGAAGIVKPSHCTSGPYGDEREWATGCERQTLNSSCRAYGEAGECTTPTLTDSFHEDFSTETLSSCPCVSATWMATAISSKTLIESYSSSSSSMTKRFPSRSPAPAKLEEGLASACS